VVRGPEDAVGNILIGAAAAVIEGADRHEGALRSDSGHTDAVVSGGDDSSGHMHTVGVNDRGGRIVVVVHEVVGPRRLHARQSG